VPAQHRLFLVVCRGGGGPPLRAHLPGPNIQSLLFGDSAARWCLADLADLGLLLTALAILAPHTADQILLTIDESSPSRVGWPFVHSSAVHSLLALVVAISIKAVGCC